MIDKLTPVHWQAVHVPNSIDITAVTRWMESQNIGRKEWMYYGKSSQKHKVTFAFKNKGQAMLFKLTFAG